MHKHPLLCILLYAIGMEYGMGHRAMDGLSQSESKHLNDTKPAGTLLDGSRYADKLQGALIFSISGAQGYTFCTDGGNLWELFSSVYAQSGIGSSQICM